VAKTLRVHHLAKELGVASKDIIAKCNAEEVQPPLKNHMAVVSIGLAESIREWFSAGADVTTIEVASPVDLAKVKKPRKRKAKPAEVSAPEEAGVAVSVEAAEAAGAQAPSVAATAAAEALGEPPTVTPLGPPTVEEALEVSAPAVEEQLPAAEEIAAVAVEVGEAAEPERAPEVGAAQVPGEAEAPVLAPSEAPSEPEEPAKPVEPAVPEEPIVPAGPRLVPKPAELRGPRVVRIEAPEPVRMPRPRPVQRPAALQPPTTETPDLLTERGAPARGRGGRGRRGAAETAAGRARSPRRRTSTVDVAERLKEWRDQDLLERKERLASATGHGVRARRSAERIRRIAGPFVQPARRTQVAIVLPIAVKDLCAAVGAPFSVVFAKLMEHTDRPYKITDSVDEDAAELVAMDLGITLTVRRELTAFEKLEAEVKARERRNLQLRPPIVAMLGHVDHGKTSLLDVIRRTHVVDGEAGGITQHIGAYQVRRGAWNVTFLDTPGHEAFTAMRARGAILTDVVVLVVAADDGVMPQTIEAINHARAAGVQIVVALNKIDLPGIDVNRVYAQLAEQGLVPAEWGGETDVVKTSAITGEGIDDLLAHLTTLSELMDLSADPGVPAQGTVIEARLHEDRGVVAQVLVREGTLAVGQVVVCGPGAGRVRTLLDHHGKRVKEAGPGTPVEVLGLDGLPDAGDRLYVVDSLSDAKRIAEEVRARRREEALSEIRKPQTLEELLRGSEEGEFPELNLIVKADVQGSVDVLKKSLGEFPSDKARLRILHAGVGAISEADVELARASKAILIGFHVVADDGARQLAEQYGVEIRLYRVIYDVHDDVLKALEGLLEPEEKEESRAKLEVRQVFNITRVGRVAGCLVTDGVVGRHHNVRLIRDGRIMTEGHEIGSLKRFKDDAREVRAGLECGIKIEGYDDVKPGDVIETYEVVEVAQHL
jgi:translation initiation factor IF-2